MRNGILTVILASALGFSAQAAEGDVIVALKNQTGLRAVSTLGLNFNKTISKDLNIVLLSPEYRVLDSKRIVEILNDNPHVRWAQLDHPVTMRESIPNDPDFGQQWALKSDASADIQATYAWDFGKGGKTVDGSDVVVAIVDQGVDVTHPSLVENIWVNSAEIAGNGIDDDGNGYIDDINGWDAVTDLGNIQAGSHATHVAGIIGARGDDSQQVVGVNWDSKIMSVRVLGWGDKDFTSTVLDGYGYIVKQKQLWIDSNGAQGANVVATNSSFGVDRGNCESGQYPAWNEMYDLMGSVGILSAAATINGNHDVDQIGDVPTACSSEFIIGVTNTNSEGKKYSNAGYGATHIDLGAPGTAILSTVLNSGLGEKTGTSMATPHVAGAIGFLHSVASRSFRNLSQQDPAGAALVMKQLLLESTSEQADLKGKTVTGGRLNLNAAAAALSLYSQQ